MKGECLKGGGVFHLAGSVHTVRVAARCVHTETWGAHAAISGP